MQASGTSAEALTDALLAFYGHASRVEDGAVFELAHELDLTLSQLHTLFVVSGADAPPTLTELAPKIHLSVPATGRVLDALERLGLLERREDATDRRVKRLVLTAQGDELTGRFAASKREGLLAFVHTLSDDQREALSRALTPVLEEHR